MGWLRRADRRPSGIEAALRRHDAALLRLAAGQRGAVLATLTSLAELEGTIRRNKSLRENLRPLPWLDPATWLPELVSDVGGCVELKLAVAAASAWDRDLPVGLQPQPGTWPRSVSVALRGLAHASLDARRPPTWSDRSDAAVPDGRPVAWLADVHVRHAAGVTAHDHENDDGSGPTTGRRGVATTFALGRWVAPSALGALVSGQVDEALFDRLLRCLSLFDPRGDWRAAAPRAPAPEPPLAHAWLALRWLLVQQGRDALDVPLLPDERPRRVRLRPSPDWPTQLRRGRIDRVLADARRRFHVAGLPVVEPPDPPAGSTTGDRLAAALLLPISGADSVAILRQLLDPTRIPIRDIRRHTTDEGGTHATA